MVQKESRVSDCTTTVHDSESPEGKNCVFSAVVFITAFITRAGCGEEC